MNSRSTKCEVYPLSFQKPRHPSHVLKSPGIKSAHAKPTLSNHYSSSGAGSVFSTSQSHVHPSAANSSSLSSSYGSQQHPGQIPSPPAFPAPLSPADAAAAAAHSLSHSDRPSGLVKFRKSSSSSMTASSSTSSKIKNIYRRSCNFFNINSSDCQ